MAAPTPVPVDPELVAILLAPWMRLVAFVWGAMWGSFANVLIYRIPRDMSIVRPRSRCGSCEAPIAWWDNVPIVSWLVLRGKCRRCEAPIGLRYLAVELLCGVMSFALYMLAVVAPLLAGGGLAGLVAWQLWFAFCVGLLVVTYTDLDLWIIPDEVVLPLAAVGLLTAAIEPDLLGVSLADATLAAATGWLLVVVMRWLWLKLRGLEALGLGDGKLLAMVGAFCGTQGLVWTIGAGALQGLLVSVPMLLLGRRLAATDLQDVHGDDPELGHEDPNAGVMGVRVPFGPFLALAALEFVLLRRQLDAFWEWVVG